MFQIDIPIHSLSCGFMDDGFWRSSSRLERVFLCKLKLGNPEVTPRWGFCPLLCVQLCYWFDAPLGLLPLTVCSVVLLRWRPAGAWTPQYLLCTVIDITLRWGFSPYCVFSCVTDLTLRWGFVSYCVFSCVTDWKPHLGLEPECVLCAVIDVRPRRGWVASSKIPSLFHQYLLRCCLIRTGQIYGVKSRR
jgi:hypothetical protein